MKRFLSLAATATLALTMFSAVTPAHAASTGSTVSLVFKTTLVSNGTTIETLPGGIQYGWNNLNGTTTWGTSQATMQFLGDVNYRGGSGPFNGYITVTRSDGTKIAFSASGSALYLSGPNGSSTTHFSGNLSVISGTGEFLGATGIGTMVGIREGALGTPARFTWRLEVAKR